MISSLIDKALPALSVSAWAQGNASLLDDLAGKVALIEIFQVNCPGCFLYSLPKAIRLFQQYGRTGLVVLGIATAFEDFSQNNLENLLRLINHGEVVGETLRVLNQQGLLTHGRLPYRLPFPVAMDRLIKVHAGEVTEYEISAFIADKFPDAATYPEAAQRKMYQQVKQYLESLEYHAETFERFQLRGTPSHLLVDKQGILRASVFGEYPELEAQIQALLKA